LSWWAGLCKQAPDAKERSVNELMEVQNDVERPVVAIVQSCYVPWRGFFDIIKKVDHFVIYDDVQFVKRHWHNRNRIKTAQGPVWLTVPVNTKGKYFQNIDETMVSEKWAEKHWRSISMTYRRAPYFEHFADRLEAAYNEVDGMQRLTDVNVHLLRTISEILDLRTTFMFSSQFAAQGQKTDRLLSLCKALDASVYLSGPSAKSYFEEEKFQAAGISVEWMDYSGYPEYPQLFAGPFEPAVSALDLLFNVGPKVLDFMQPFPERKLERGSGA
jgi:hypothetical protein